MSIDLILVFKYYHSFVKSKHKCAVELRCFPILAQIFSLLRLLCISIIKRTV